MMFALAFAFAAAFVVAAPFWDRAEYGYLERSSDPQARERSYLRMMATLWPVAAIATLLAGSAIFTITLAHPPLWLQPVHIDRDFFIGFVGALAPLSALFALPQTRAYLAKQIDANPLFPRTFRERVLFLGVSVTAGVTEEILYRGFLLHLLTPLWPTMAIAIPIAIAALCFGLAHLGQGLKGVAITGIVGAMLCALYCASGSLLWPIVVHILIDARVAIMPGPKAIAAIEAAA